MRCGGMIVEGLVIAGLGLSAVPWFAGLMMAVIGFSMALQFIIVGSLRPRIVPAHLLGRATSAGRLIGLAGAPVLDSGTTNRSGSSILRIAALLTTAVRSRSALMGCVLAMIAMSTRSLTRLLFAGCPSRA